MTKKKLTREEKKKLKEEEKRKKLEKLRAKVLPPLPTLNTSSSPINKEIPSLSDIPKNQDVVIDNTPIINENPNAYKSMLVEIYLNSKDISGKWSWGLKRKELDVDYDSIIEPYLKHPKSTKWGTLELELYGKKNKTKHHHIPVTALNEEIQLRWQEIELDYSEVFTFRISGKQRIFGYRIKNKYFIVWWDPKHELIPS